MKRISQRMISSDLLLAPKKKQPKTKLKNNLNITRVKVAKHEESCANGGTNDECACPAMKEKLRIYNVIGTSRWRLAVPIKFVKAN